MFTLNEVIIDHLAAYLSFDTQIQFIKINDKVKNIIINLDYYYQGLFLQHTGLDKYPVVESIPAREMYRKAKKYSCYHKEHLWVKVPVGIKFLGWCRQCKTTFYDGKLTFYPPNS